jgi:uncharacterized protein (TIGR02246 family)
MNKIVSLVVGGGLLALLAAGVSSSGHGQAGPQAKEGDDKEREADREALRKSAYDFVQAFEKGDAKALADQWTEQGEIRDDSGAVLRGRAAIEKAYAVHFREKPKSKIEIDIRSIRFLSRDTAIEQGVLRLKPAGAELPTSTRYSALHVREDGKWKIAGVQESGATEDKLEDLAWLIGDWEVKGKDKEVQMKFAWNAKKTQIRNQFSVKEGGKVAASGIQIISQDPQSGQLRSWHFDDDGGHGQSMWFRDGNRWAMDSLGVLADGRETAATNVLTRLNDDAFVWRSTQRTLVGTPVSDTEPVKVVRVKSGK